MAKTFKVAITFTGSITMQDATVKEYIRAMKETAEDGDKFCQHLVQEMFRGDMTEEQALQRLFVNGFRDGIKDLGEKINRELMGDDGRYKQSPATVGVTANVK